ncbi:MAG: hypothetical protein ACRDUV_03035 [Pseudonocardiaceae bacterium]
MTQFESSLELVDIARIFRRTLELEGRGVRFESIRDDDPFASLMRQPDFQCVASRVKSIGSWAVRLGIFDEGDFRILELLAVYHSALTRAEIGTRYTYSKTASNGRVQAVIIALQEADSSLTRIR